MMLIPRNSGCIPMIVTDFTHLNSGIVKLITSILLVRDAIEILVTSEDVAISLADIKYAYDTLLFAKESKQYCSIAPYYGSNISIYQRLGIGLSVL